MERFHSLDDSGPDRDSFGGEIAGVQKVNAIGPALDIEPFKVARGLCQDIGGIGSVRFRDQRGALLINEHCERKVGDSRMDVGLKSNQRGSHWWLEM
jgi:hypothetical protein